VSAWRTNQNLDHTIEELETLDQIDGSNAVILDRRAPKPDRVLESGTTLTMAPLRRAC